MRSGGAQPGASARPTEAASRRHARGVTSFVCMPSHLRSLAPRLVPQEPQATGAPPQHRALATSVGMAGASQVSGAESGDDDGDDADTLELVKRYANCPQTGISLESLREFGVQVEDPALRTATLLTAASFLAHELPIRLAHRIVELAELPYGLSDTKGVRKVREWYIQSLRELVAQKAPATLEDDARFTACVERIYERHSPTLVSMASGVQELRRKLISGQGTVATAGVGADAGMGKREGATEQELPELLEQTLRPYLDRFYSSRIGIRTLIEQHCALHHPKPGWVGVIKTECSPHKIALEAM